jgi:hypothetical protein
VPNVNNNIEYRQADNPTTFTDGATTITVDVDQLITSGFTTGAYYYITPVAESADGQRNGEETWFEKR